MREGLCSPSCREAHTCDHLSANPCCASPVSVPVGRCTMITCQGWDPGTMVVWCVCWRVTTLRCLRSPVRSPPLSAVWTFSMAASPSRVRRRCAPGACVCASVSWSHRYVSTTAPERIFRYMKVPSGDAHCRGSVRHPRESLVAW